MYMVCSKANKGKLETSRSTTWNTTFDSTELSAARVSDYLILCKYKQQVFLSN